MSFGSSASLKRWDGRKGVGTDWDKLTKDPELSTRDGDCLIHLFSYNEWARNRRSVRSAAFQIPLSRLLAAKCCPLLEEHCAARPSGIETRHLRTLDEIRAWHRANPKRTIELFIAAPSTSDRRQLQRHEVTTRNFFAWVRRRPLVGETLGGAIVGLLHCMHDFRRGDGIDNIADLTHYLEEMGYLRLAGQPEHCLAILRLAETFRLKELYLRALAHCVGMRAVVVDRPEYQFLSLATRQLIQDAGVEANERLSKAAAMLSNFLDQELSEAHLGISTGLRAHLERFRSFLLSFYTTKLGYYPPRLSDASAYRAMAQDFKALYKFLVDESYRSSDAMPSVAVGGICTLQLVQSFDNNNNFESRRHPLPKLPPPSPLAQPKRVSWLSRQRADEAHLNHVALVKASNWNETLFQNDLVRAFRKFEEKCAVSLHKVDRHEKISLADGRKIRWILVYAAHQTLELATQRPRGVPDDHSAKYVVSLAKNTLVPWHDSNLTGGLLRARTDTVAKRFDKRDEAGCAPHTDEKIVIRPDIDYLAIVREERDSVPGHRRWASVPSHPLDIRASRSCVDLSGKSLARSTTFCTAAQGSRHNRLTMLPSLEIATGPSSLEPLMQQDLEFSPEMEMLENNARTLVHPASLATRSASTASESSTSAISTFTNTTSIADTLDSATPLESPVEADESERRWSRRNSAALVAEQKQDAGSKSKSAAAKRRTMNTALEGYNFAARALGHLMDQERRSPAPKQVAGLPHAQTMPLIAWGKDAREEAYVLPEEPDDWTAMQAFFDGKDPLKEDAGSHYAWEQYADLGGLTEVR